MAGDRTEQPTPRKLEEARKRGQVARSQEVPSMLSLLGAVLVLAAIGGSMLTQLETMVIKTLSLETLPDEFTAGSVTRITLDSASFVVQFIGPLLGTVLVLALAGHVSQIGLRFTPMALKPDVKHLNPISGAKRLFSRRSLGEFTKNLLKLTAVSLVVFLTLRARWEEIVVLSGSEPRALMLYASGLVFDVTMRVVLLMVVLAAADLVWQRRVFMKEQKMTVQEVRDEMKTTDMNPRIRFRIRDQAMKAAQGRMLSEVATADVVITNPTHFACALRYDNAKESAPRLVAKGADLMAFKLRELATEHKVPIIENPPLARTLYSKVDVGKEIPETLFVAVAEIIALVWHQKRRRGHSRA